MHTLENLNSTFDDLDISIYSESFVPYFYLDGHRSGHSAVSDEDKYASGLKFFLRTGCVMKTLGFRNMVTMVHTSRNFAVPGRIESIKNTVMNNFNIKDKYLSGCRFKFYGEIESYSKNGFSDFCSFIKNVEEKTSGENSFTHHILINYSEDWALHNIDKINSLPDISTVIRFTKGFYSGGWIPVKMQESVFVYSQIPSVSEYWSDESLQMLLLIALQNWSFMKNYIGRKEYFSNERELIHIERDINLNFCHKKLDINGGLHNRIIVFGVHGPVIYEY